MGVSRSCRPLSPSPSLALSLSHSPDRITKYAAIEYICIYHCEMIFISEIGTLYAPHVCVCMFVICWWWAHLPNAFCSPHLCSHTKNQMEQWICCWVWPRMMFSHTHTHAHQFHVLGTFISYPISTSIYIVCAPCLLKHSQWLEKTYSMQITTYRYKSP